MSDKLSNPGVSGGYYMFYRCGGTRQVTIIIFSLLVVCCKECILKASLSVLVSTLYNNF
jgi:hypothetical protein